MALDRVRKRHRALNAVLSIAMHQLDTEAALLAALRGRIALLEEKRSALSTCRSRPDTDFFFETGRYATAYIRALRDQEACLIAEIDTLRRDAARHEAKVMALYKEKVTAEATRDGLAADIVNEEDRSETSEREERTLGRWLRNRVSLETEGGS